MFKLPFDIIKAAIDVAGWLGTLGLGMHLAVKFPSFAAKVSGWFSAI